MQKKCKSTYLRNRNSQRICLSNPMFMLCIYPISIVFIATTIVYIYRLKMYNFHTCFSASCCYQYYYNYYYCCCIFSLPIVHLLQQQQWLKPQNQQLYTVVSFDVDTFQCNSIKFLIMHLLQKKIPCWQTNHIHFIKNKKEEKEEETIAAPIN